MLGSSSGAVAMLMGRGQISNLLLEIAGLDGAEILKFLMSGDQNVQLRCAAAAFDVKSGLMSSRALVLDTTDTVIYGNGQVSLANEAMDLTLRPYPKDMSILSLRSPLKMAGSFASPKAGPDKGALAGRAGLALAAGRRQSAAGAGGDGGNRSGPGCQLRARLARGMPRPMRRRASRPCRNPRMRSAADRCWAGPPQRPPTGRGRKASARTRPR